MRELVFNGRHLHTGIIMGLQDIMSIRPNIRSQMDYTVSTAEDTVQSRKRLYETVFGVFPTFQKFCTVLNAATQNYGALVVNTVTTDAKKQVTWYRAEYPVPDFSFGCRSYRHFVMAPASGDGDDGDDGDDEEEDVGG